MCTALEEVKKEGITEGRKEGREEGRKEGRVLTYFEFGVSLEEIAKKTGITVKEVEKVLEENGVLNPV